MAFYHFIRFTSKTLYWPQSSEKSDLKPELTTWKWYDTMFKRISDNNDRKNHGFVLHIDAPGKSCKIWKKMISSQFLIVICIGWGIFTIFLNYKDSSPWHDNCVNCICCILSRCFHFSLLFSWHYGYDCYFFIVEDIFF